jgi:3-oxoacyl-[acyl-carrier protein] reductase
VAIAGPHEDTCQTVAARISERGGQSVGFATDVRELEQITDLFGRVGERFGSVDILVYSAAGPVGGIAGIAGMTWDGWHASLAVDLTGAFFCMQQAIPSMTRAGGGKVVLVSSIAGLRGMGSRPSYAAAKGALVALTADAANELAPLNIQVNAVAPGFVDTPRSAKIADESRRASAELIPGRTSRDTGADRQHGRVPRL